MCRSCLTAEVEVLELEADLEVATSRRQGRTALAAEVARLEHLAATTVRAPWRRDPFPHELEARVRFAELEELLDRRVERLGRQLVDDRRRHLELIAGWGRTIDRSTDLAYMLRDPAVGPQAPPGPGRSARLDELDAYVASRHVAYRGELEAVYRDGWVRVVDEAREQGVPVGRFLPDLTDAPDELRNALDRRARSLSGNPLNQLLGVLDDRAYELSADLDVDAFVDELVEAGDRLSERGLEDQARQAVSASEGRGRTDASRVLPQPARIYASELLDGNTCGPCSLIDGREYDDEPASLRDYPAGRYRSCEGGMRCRGTRVFVWPDEAEATLRNPGDVPPPTTPPGGYPDPPGPSRPPATQPDAPAPDRPAWVDEDLAPILSRLPEDRSRVGLRDDGTPDVTALGDSRDTHVPGATVLEHERTVREAGAVIEARAQASAQARIAERGLTDPAELDREVDAIRADLAGMRDELIDADEQARTAWSDAGRPETWERGDVSGWGAPVSDVDVAAWLPDDGSVRYLELRRRRRELHDRQEALLRGRQEARTVYADELRAGRLEALGEARRMGGTVDLVDEGVEALPGRGLGTTNRQGIDAVAEAAASYPTDWLAASNRLGPIAAQAHPTRAFQVTYRRADGSRPAFLRVPEPSGDGGPGDAYARRVAIHELGHRMEESLPALGRLEHAFHRRRSAGAAGNIDQPQRIRRLNTLVPGSGYRDAELAREDKYAAAYTGKEYGTDGRVARGGAGLWELFTTGVESVLGNGTYATGDRELVDFILGTLATL